MKRTILATLLAGAIGFAGYAFAQSVPVPQVLSVGPTDLFNDVVGGQPKTGNTYATAAQITATSGYHDLGTTTTDPAYTAGVGVWNVFGHATGTVTAVTITTPANPGDGQRLCYWMDQTTTTLTFTANTGQTISSSASAGVASTSQCITYNATTKAWKSSN